MVSSYKTQNKQKNVKNSDFEQFYITSNIEPGFNQYPIWRDDAWHTWMYKLSIYSSSISFEIKLGGYNFGS